MKKKFKIHTLGCRTNQYESQAYAKQLSQLGYEEAKEDEHADICIVNTCTVTASADKSSKMKIKQYVNENPDALHFVTGCMVENEKKAVEEISPNIKVVSNLDKENLISHIFPKEENLPEFRIERFEAHTRAFLKVQDGCNSFCTYCVIPYVRGRSRSKTLDEIIQEAKDLIKNGYKEIVITGINVGDFDGNQTPALRLSDLIRQIDALDGLKRLRVSSIDPDEVDDDLADAIINCKNTCPSMHVVLQSGSNVVLKRMNRKYTVQMFLDTCEKLTSLNPDFTFTTDVIVGFPGESEKDFEETMQLIEDIKFAKVHMFPYSIRPRTRAALYKDQIPKDLVFERKQRLLRHAEKMSFELREKFVGRVLPVLFESIDEKNPELISGHTDNFLRVMTPMGNLRSNNIAQVELIENTPDGFLGKVVSENYSK